MNLRSAQWLRSWPRFAILNTDNKGPQGPWGGGGGNNDGNGGGDGPRNPWSLPPGGKRTRPGPSALDEFLKRARVGGPGGGGGGFGGLPGGAAPRSLWALGIGLLVLGWLIFTSFHSISPQERAVVTFFGRYSDTLQPGIRMTLPAPFNRVTKVDVQNIRTENFPENSGENLTLTGDQNLVDLNYSVRWDIKNPQDFIFQIKDPTQTVRAASESAMREVMATVELDQAIGAGRGMIEGRVRQRLQEVLDEYDSGIRIQGVAISKAGPPSSVNNAFKDVTAAQQDAVAARNQSLAYAQQIIARAQGEAGQFDRIYEQYKASPVVTRRRMYYETMEAVLAKSNKTVIEAPGVTPYLPLPELKKRQAEPEPEASAGAAR